MKKILITRLLLAVSLVVSLAGCNKDFLEKNPLDQISSATFWKTEADLNMGMAGVYSNLRAQYFGYPRIFLEGLTDNAYAQYAWDGNVQAISLGNTSPVTGGIIDGVYSGSYTGIAGCNYFLDNVDKVSVSDAVKNKYKAEARFLRAFFYFELVTTYGGVPLYLQTPQSADEAKIKQSSKEEVLNYIYADLDFAITNLSDQAYAGHAVKGSAQALKTRALLFQEKWADAAALANTIISGGKFSLAPSYQGIFLSASQESNPEIMFSTKYLAPNNYQADYGGLDIEQGWWAALAPYQDVIDEYEAKDGKSISQSPLYNAAEPYTNRDPRLDFTYKLKTEIWRTPTGAVWNVDPSPTGYSIEKYVDLSRLPFGYDMANKTDQDFVHLRYADVLLMYAEAKNEASGPDASVFAALNQIRARNDVKMPPVDQTLYNSKEKLREFIRHERRVELAMEGLRFFDLKRWHIAHIKMPQMKAPSGVDLKFEEKNYVWPFPQFEIDNNPQLDQNPNY